MGVTGLWTVVQPCARPVKLETLNKKRLAVDASIWIYQFLKAVRDKEGNALRNSHVVGFFRRICKLLFFGIKPVFVFDGGAPVLKRQTIAGRKKRREGRREDAVRTAGQLLAVQMHRIAEEEAAAEKRHRSGRRQKEEETVPDNPVYVEEALMTEKEKRQNRSFRKKDAYHLPSLEMSLEQMGAPEDPRIMSREELEQYARQFHQGEDINLYDFSKIDFDSPFFISLPATDRYNILNAARLRSRLRMGYSKEQLDTMFPDRMAFSKFQIERVKERNDLTQRLMNLNGMNGEEAFYSANSGQRIAGERGREYVLVKDNAVEGGWALGVVGNKEGQEDRPIDVDRYGQQDLPLEKDEMSDDEAGFEDVPIEGLNRLPKLPFLQKGVFDQSIREQRREASGGRNRREIDGQLQRDKVGEDDDDALFVENNPQAAGLDASPRTERLFDSDHHSDDEDFRKAIEMSMETAQDDFEDALPVDSHPLPAPTGERAPSPNAVSDDDEMDFAAAVAQSKKTARLQLPRVLPSHSFDGPLPFESVKLGKISEGLNKDVAEPDKDAGGFVRETPRPKKKELPLPPWFVADRSKEEFIIDKAADSIDEGADQEISGTSDHLFLKNYRSPDVIDVDSLPDTKEVIDLEHEAVVELDQDHAMLVEVTGKGPETNDPRLVDATPTTDFPLSDEKGASSPVRVSPASDIDRHDTNVGEQKSPESRSPSAEFEDVEIPAEALVPDTDISVPADVGEPFEDTVEIDPQEAEEGAEFSDPEDADLMRQLAEEAEEHVRFAATLNSATQTQNVVDYEQELKQLRSQQKKDRRDADEVTQVMINECQQLLAFFGLPYITAPMEAEAQCAELVALGLVDGVVTDDSDIFLFGGTRVYKNVFNQSKFVECYLTSDMEKEYALHRQKLISFAHLLGSDYTEGISGIGPVTALEILTEFGSLEEFRDWWTEVQLGKDMGNGDHAAFFKKFRKNASKIFLPPSFPDRRVDEAYLEPEVDSDPSPFQWGVPDLNGLRQFLMATIGWSPERTDEILVPVIRDMNRREQEGTQSNITNFFNGPQGAGAFAPRIRSGGQSRMEKAFSRLREEAVSSRDRRDDDDLQDVPSEPSNEPATANTNQTSRGSKRTSSRPAQSVSAETGKTKSKKRKTRRQAP